MTPRETMPSICRQPAPAAPLERASQEGLAYEADVNRSYLSRLEKGASSVGLEIIVKLATVLKVEPAELLRLPTPRRKRGR